MKTALGTMVKAIGMAAVAILAGSTVAWATALFTGTASDDTGSFGDGNNTLSFGSGTDVIDMGAGYDAILFGAGNAAIWFEYSGNSDAIVYTAGSSTNDDSLLVISDEIEIRTTVNDLLLESTAGDVVIRIAD